jgi:hypothetical protein
MVTAALGLWIIVIALLVLSLLLMVIALRIVIA